MLCALIDSETSRVSYLGNVVEPDKWEYPDNFYHVTVENFEIPENHHSSDYMYLDGEFVYNPYVDPNESYDVIEAMKLVLNEFNMFETLPDEHLAHMATFMDDWAVGQEYSVGDIRKYIAIPYRCLQNHISQEAWTPLDAPSLWARILPGQDGDIGEWVQPDSTNPYMAGDMVTHNGKTWRSTVDNNVWEPGVYGWEEVIQ